MLHGKCPSLSSLALVTLLVLMLTSFRVCLAPLDLVVRLASLETE